MSFWRNLWLPVWMRLKKLEYAKKGLSVGANPRIRRSVDISKGAVIGDNANIGERVKIKGKVFIGNNVLINDGCYFFSSTKPIFVEDDVTFGPFAFVVTSDHDFYDTREKGIEKPVRICRGSYIRGHAAIRKGVTVGENSTVDVGSVVTENVPPFSVVAGNNAKVVKKLNKIKN